MTLPRFALDGLNQKRGHILSVKIQSILEILQYPIADCLYVAFFVYESRSNAFKIRTETAPAIGISTHATDK